MFFLKDDEHIISLHPSYFGPMVKKYLTNKLIEEVEGKHNGEYFVLCVLDNMEYSEGKVEPGTGNAQYKVHFRAIVWKPFRGEVVDGEVSQVIETGIFVDVGPLKVFISKAAIPSDTKFDPHSTPPQWTNGDGDQVIEKGTHIRVKLNGIRSELGGHMFAIATIKEDYLGAMPG